MIKNKLSFAKGNAKLDKSIAIFSLPAGHTCPFAKDCFSKADRITGKIKDGKDIQFRCYAASSEALFTNVRRSRWHNFELLKSAKSIEKDEDLIIRSIPQFATLVRMHQSGDFYNQSYFDAWLNVALKQPHRIFYGYTKALPFWVARLKQLPENFRLVASVGGTHDKLIEPHNLRHAKVVFSEAAAGLMPIDHDDSHVWNYHGNFAILLHNTQPTGTTAAAAWQIIKNSVGGYTTDYFAHKTGESKYKFIPKSQRPSAKNKLVTR